MGVQRKRRRREERLEEEEREQGREPAQEAVQEKERPREREAAPTDRVLDLQKTAGNRATNAAIARWGFPWFPATAAPQWPKEPQVIVDGEAIPLLSWSWPESGNSGTGTSGTAKENARLNDVHVMTALGDHSADLALKLTRGDHIKTVVIVKPGKDGKGVTVTLHDVLITGYSVSGDTEQWSMNFAKKEFSQEPPKAQPRP